jgi:hypothetical protein
LLEGSLGAERIAKIDLDVFLDRVHITMDITLQEFLLKHRAQKGAPHTHTRIGNKSLGIAGGCYFVPEDKRGAFYKIYNNHLASGRFEYLTEAQGEVCPLLVDLDFRYDCEVEERQHSVGLVDDVVALYCEALSSTVELPKDLVVDVFVMQKPHVNCCEAQTKDGIHIVFPMPLDRATQCLVRDHVKLEIDSVTGGLGLTNGVNDVLDESITLGRTNWQLFGSRKPGNEAYEITEHYKWRTDDGGSLQLETVRRGKADITTELHQQLSARMFVLDDNGGVAEPLPVKASIQPQHTSWVERLTKSPTSSAPAADMTIDIPAHVLGTGSALSGMSLPANASSQEVVAMAQEYIDGTLNKPESYKIHEIAQYAMCIGSEYYDDCNKWFQVGLALHATHACLFGVWMGFSAKSSKFDVSAVAKYKADWDRMSCLGGKRTLTARSIMYWARTSNPDGYYSINSQCVSHYMEETLRGAAEYDVAEVMFCKFKDVYKCVSIKNRTWYQYVGHRWMECDGGVGLRNKISAWQSSTSR